jgi:hypothetical protein
MTQETKTVININNIQSLIKENTFDNIQSIVSEYGIEVRTLKSEDELNNLYLLITNKKETNLTEIQMECNGLIFEKETNKIVCMAQNKFNTISDDTSKLLNNKVRLEYCEDGTVIRLYNYNGKWFTATSRCIDARKSYWSSDKTFDDMFFEIINNSGYNINEFDTCYTHSFILIHKDNRIVVSHKYNNLIYINRVNNITREEDFTNYFYNENPTRCIRRTKQINSVNGINYKLDDYYQYDKRGVIIKSYDEATNSWKLYQHDFDSYNKIKEIRGNVPLIRIRYLELLNEPEKIELLEKYYPEHKMVFAMIKYSINKLYKEIHNLYYQSHIKHSITIEESHKFYRTLKQLHGTFKKQGTIITLEEVVKKVNSYDTYVIKVLLGWVN